MDFKGFAARLGIEEEDFLELVELYVMTCRADIEKIRQGILLGVPADAAAAAHSIKGAAGNLGFEEMAGLAQKMEIQARAGSLENFKTYISDLEKQITGLGKG
ncbi:Hpt domain-containing protein [Desulfospira joergensenii]|uniref:Hpt domain-containing protein n=1 Tax=Desulfospira joergensenii TaxID=53329 RepID=UPI0003B45FA6|nr:Hpt domain-containing protein [Desulfospira joergensenii]